MRLLIISKFGDDVVSNRIDRLNNISSVYGYCFYHNLINFCKDKNIELYIDIKNIGIDFETLDDYDHCFYLFNRGINLLKNSNYNVLKNKIRGNLITIAPTSKIVGKEDYLLFFAGKQKINTLKINMVSDQSLLPREQNNKKITILVDHEYYGNKNSNILKLDKTSVIIESLLKFKKTWKGLPLDIIQINTNVTEGFSYINSLEDIKNYDRLKAISFLNIYKIYSKSDIFVVTHQEAMGLSCVECNQAGCKVVSPDGYIKSEYGQYLDIEYVKNDNYEWDEIIKKLNPFRTHRKVRNLTYYKAIRTIFKKLHL